MNHIHPSSIAQVAVTIHDPHCNNPSDKETEQLQGTIQSSEGCVQRSWKEQKTFVRQKGFLSHTRSGKVFACAVTKKQRKNLQSIPNESLQVYLEDKK
jgi:hypothetical protein